MSNLLDGVTRHQIFVQRYAAGREREAVAFIERMIKTVNSRLASDITDFSRGRLESILFDLEGYAKETLASYSTLTVQEALKFAQYEIGFNERLLGQNISASLTLPAPNQVSAGIFSSVMNVEPKRGYTIGQALKMFEGKKSSQIVDTIRSGVILGDTREQITTALTRLGDLQKQQAATLTRTITNHVSTESRSLFMSENEDVLEGYEWVATLDSRTSLVCGSRDGVVYPFGNDPIRSPKPPAHFSCRSTIVPKVKDEFDLTGGRVGVRPAIGADGVEQVRGSTDYQSWLTRQPKAFQIEVLGKERAELFRRGDLKLTNFVDSGGGTISLSRLRELEPLAFSKNETFSAAPAKKYSLFSKVSFIGDGSLDEYEKIILSRATLDQQLLIAKIDKPLIIENSKGGSYNSALSKVVASPTSRDGITFIHEYGHHIDYKLGKMVTVGGITAPQSYTGLNEAFTKAFNADRKALGIGVRATNRAALDKLEKQLSTQIQKTSPLGVVYTIKGSVTPFQIAQSDIIDAMTGGKFQSDYNMAGHGIRYYKRKGTKNQETFANLFSLRGTNSWEDTKTLFPSLAKEFDKIIFEAAK